MDNSNMLLGTSEPNDTNQYHEMSVIDYPKTQTNIKDKKIKRIAEKISKIDLKITLLTNDMQIFIRDHKIIKNILLYVIILLYVPSPIKFIITLALIISAILYYCELSGIVIYPYLTNFDNIIANIIENFLQYIFNKIVYYCDYCTQFILRFI